MRVLKKEKEASLVKNHNMHLSDLLNKKRSAKRNRGKGTKKQRKAGFYIIAPL